MSKTTILADHNIVLEGSKESRAYMAKMLPIALDWAHVHRVASFDSRVAKGDFCKDYKEFCRGNLGLPRAKMPQLREDVAERFARGLAKMGIRVKKTRIPVENLKATQKEINSDKAEGIAGATLSGKYDPTKDPVLVSREGHILDGHHRWAAALVATLKDGVKRAMSVIQIDLPIRELLQRAINFDGVAFAGFDEGNYKKASPVTAASKARNRFINDVLSMLDDMVQSHVRTDSNLEVRLEKALLKRFGNRSGIRIRDPKAFAEDLLYGMTVKTSHDWNKVAELFDVYVSGDNEDFERLASLNRTARFEEGNHKKASVRSLPIGSLVALPRKGDEDTVDMYVVGPEGRITYPNNIKGREDRLDDPSVQREFWEADRSAPYYLIMKGNGRILKYKSIIKKMMDWRARYYAGSVHSDTRLARFEEGKPADPTKNMSPEEAAKWEKWNEYYTEEYERDGEVGGKPPKDLKSAFEAAYFGDDDYDPSLDETPNAGMRALQKAIPGASWKTHAWVTGDLGKWYVFRTVSGAKDQIMVSADGRKTLELPRNPGNYRPYVKQLQRMASFRGVYASRWDDDYDPSLDETPNAGMRALQKAIPGASWKTHAWVTGDLGKWYVFRTVSGAKDQIMVSADGRKTLELPRNPGNYRPYVKQLQRMASFRGAYFGKSARRHFYYVVENTNNGHVQWHGYAYNESDALQRASEEIGSEVNPRYHEVHELDRSHQKAWGALSYDKTVEKAMQEGTWDAFFMPRY